MSFYRIHLIISFLLLSIISTDCLGQAVKENTAFFNPDKQFSVSMFGDYISSAELQPNPKSTDPIERDATLDLNGTYGFGAELTYKPPINHLDLIFYISSEYIRFTQDNFALPLNDSLDVAISEQFIVIPLELGVKWHLPIGSDNWKFYIGGGGGLYFGKETRTILDMQSSQLSSKPDFSLNILTGVDYYLEKNFSANLELKFREAAFDSESRFSSGTVTVNGNTFSLQNPFNSRFIADGVRVSLGFKYFF